MSPPLQARDDLVAGVAVTTTRTGNGKDHGRWNRGIALGLEQFLADDPVDLAGFLDALSSQSEFFARDRALVFARAPGRLDLMGGIADYSGSLVLQLPLAAATFVAVQPVDEPVFDVWSTGAAEAGDEARVAVPLAALSPHRQSDGTPDYSPVREALTADPRRRWVAYVAGTLAVLQGERGVVPGHGLRLYVHSSVPAGKGVSSSAALEVAAMQAICAVYGVELSGHDLALLCQKAENLVAGAPCGVMDQMTAAFGVKDQLLALLCQPAQLQAPVRLPDEVEVWGIDSGIRHAVSGSDYTSVRVGAFMGYRLIAGHAGLGTRAAGNGRVEVDDTRWGGHLANVSPSDWTAQFERAVPDALDGATFLERYSGTTDGVTRVDPDRSYAVRAPTAHPIFEHHRVRLFRSLLGTTNLDEEHLRLLGELMYQSHASYSACGLGSSGTDRLVELVQEAGPGRGFYGAKITGGGAGGTVAVLARRGSRDAVEEIRSRYERETGRRSLLIGGSSSGALQFGARWLER
jgi:galactokinase